MKQYDNVVLVTGGAGFIGSAFLRILVPKYQNWRFINLDALTYAGDLKKIQSIEDCENYLFINGNICDRRVVEGLFEKYKINIVVNFAAESHVDNSIKDAESFVETNIKGTYVLLDVAKIKWGFNGPSEKDFGYRFMHISTDEVYGSLQLDEESWTELSPIKPNSPYSASKASSELIVMSYFKTHGLPVIITRSSNNYGPFQNFEKLIPKIIINSLRDLSIPIYGNGENVRDWIFVEDNISALELILLRGIIGEIYNVSSQNEVKNIELANLILNNIPRTNSKILYIEDRLGHDFRYSISNSKLIRLGWRPKVSLSDGIRKTIEHYEDQ